MPIQEKCKVLNHEKIGSKYYKLTLVSPYISSHAEPGQFVEVKCSESYNPLLRRPLSLHRISKEHKTLKPYISPAAEKVFCGLTPKPSASGE